MLPLAAADPMDTLIVFLEDTFVVLLVVVGAILVLFWLTCAGLIPAMRHHRHEDKYASTWMDILKGYLVVSPIFLVNVVLVYILAALQVVLVNHTYREMVNPGRLFARTLESALDEAKPEVVSRIGTKIDENPKEAMRQITRNLSDFRNSGYYDVIDVEASIGWNFYKFGDVILLAIILFTLLRQLGLTSWHLLTFPIRRRKDGEDWGMLARRTGSEIVEMILYTVLAAVFLFACAILFAFINALTLYFMAHLLLTCAKEVIMTAMTSSVGSMWIFLLLQAFTFMLFEVALILTVGTGLLALAATKTLRLRLDRWACGWFKLPPPQEEIRKLRTPLRAALMLLLKTCGATFAFGGLLAFVVLPLLPIWLSVPYAIYFEIVSFNIALYLMRAHRDLRILLDSVFYDWGPLGTLFAERNSTNSPPAASV